jgi:hypothetical protein
MAGECEIVPGLVITYQCCRGAHSAVTGEQLGIVFTLNTTADDQGLVREA